MTIIEQTYDWAYDPGRRTATDYIILHHAAGNGSPQAIHTYHRDARGWAGIAYHYYVRKDGSVYRGRPETWNGGHTSGYNSISLGICFEGNFETEQMGAPQLEAGQALLAQLRQTYPTAAVVRHGDLGATSCPGRNFPMSAILADPSDAEADEPSAWAQAAAERALRAGIVQGDGAGNYGWCQPVTLERLLVLLDRMGKLDT